ncbi:MAG: hypothetical protein AAB215_04970 [Planctomycetota bacterium]
MNILFDQGTPVPLRHFLAHHQVATAYERGWSRLENGELLQAAETAGFQVFVSTDASLKYQQNVQGRRIAIVVLLSASWPKIQRHARAIASLVDSAKPGDYYEAPIE